jgi:pimeloyl-ACP methyl ester carboxylesterase
MPLEIVSATTQDGIKLHGSLRRPEEGTKNALPVDVLICHHGVAGNFYGSDMFDDFSDLATADGVAVIRANNRGHDPVSWATGPGGRKRIGAAYEVVSDCMQDWDAWITFAADQGFKNIGVLGHSLGGTKTIYYFGNRDDSRVRCAIAASPPRLSYSAFLRDPDGEEFSGYVAVAKAKLDEGDPSGLIDAALPVPFLGSAATYYDKYGPEEAVNILTHLPNVKLPLLAYHGTEEPAAELPMRGVLEELTEVASTQANFSHAIIPNGDHFATGQRPYVWSVMRDWLSSLS